MQREIERAGIPTVGISISLELTEKVKPPRTVFVHWHFGHPLGEPGNAAQHKAVMVEAFRALYGIKKPGGIVKPGWRWRRQKFADVPLLGLRIGPG